MYVTIPSYSMSRFCPALPNPIPVSRFLLFARIFVYHQSDVDETHSTRHDKIHLHKIPHIIARKGGGWSGRSKTLK
ncbi:hypothetical protein E2C01_102661 [Portunus trituberculatus]|uniref:Uncharacterized protein n=1 Tax=Portunus trituberculatus TaxID=210409 RepID=A0A5B7KHV8_PORTR|nr:hypothetical protein [Portunus trituberculatus]